MTSAIRNKKVSGFNFVSRARITRPAQNFTVFEDADEEQADEVDAPSSTISPRTALACLYSRECIESKTSEILEDDIKLPVFGSPKAVYYPTAEFIAANKENISPRSSSCIRTRANTFSSYISGEQGRKLRPIMRAISPNVDDKKLCLVGYKAKGSKAKVPLANVANKKDKVIKIRAPRKLLRAMKNERVLTADARLVDALNGSVKK